MITSCLFATPIFVEAKSKNVTRIMSKNKNLKKLVKRMSIYCDGVSLGQAAKTYKVKNNNKNRLSIAAFVRYQVNRDNDYTRKELKKTVVDLFGKKVDKFVCSGFLMENSYDFYDGEFAYAGGDFGNMTPKYSVNKITQKGKVYTVQITGKIKYDFTGEIKKQCKITMKVKKSKKSAYKFITKSIKYKKYKSGV